MRRAIIAALVLVNAVGAINLAADQVSAHSSAVFYEQAWAPDRNAQYKMDNNVPDGWRPEIHDGLARWSDRAGGRAPNFIPDGPATMTNAYSPCAGPNGVFSRNMSADGFPGFLGLTLVCGTSGSSLIQGFTMIFDNQINWYIGDGDVPNDRWDMQSIATHESGHATGFKGHFEADDICARGDQNQTVCGGNPNARGTKYLRTLEEHDTHTLNNAYPFLTCPPTCRLKN